MKNLTLYTILCLFLLLGSNAYAIEKTWTFDGTVQLGATNDNAISGSFTFDADTNTLSNVNVTVRYDGTNYNTNTPALVDAAYLRGVVSNAVNEPGFFVNHTTLTNAGGVALSPYVGVGYCSSVPSGTCNNITDFTNRTATNVTLTAPLDEPIPTLNEWGMIIFSCFLALVSIVMIRNRNILS